MTEGSTPPPPVYLDEDVPVRLSNELRDLGIPVQLAKDVLKPGTDDATHLKQCADDAFVMITLNRKDFRRLHWLWMSLNSWNVLNRVHAGILTVWEQAPALPDEWAPAISELLRREANNLPGRMWMWNQSKNEWTLQPLTLP